MGLGDDLAQPAQADETLDLSLEEPALSFDAPLESLEPLPALEPLTAPLNRSWFSMRSIRCRWM